jgi:hypothetical protein
MWTADSGLLRALQGLGVEKELTWVDRTIARQRKLQHPVEQRKLPPPTAPARAPPRAPAPIPLTPTTFSGALDRLERVLGVTTDVQSTPRVRPSVVAGAAGLDSSSDDDDKQQTRTKQTDTQRQQDQEKKMKSMDEITILLIHVNKWNVTYKIIYLLKLVNFMVIFMVQVYNQLEK